MIYKNIFGLLMTAFLASHLVGQDHLQTPGQVIGPATAYPQTSAVNSWNQQSPTYYSAPATPYSPVYPALPSSPVVQQPAPYETPYYAAPQYSAPQIGGAATPYSFPYSATPQNPVPQVAPHTAPYTPLYGAPYTTSPTPFAVPEVASPIALPVLPPEEAAAADPTTPVPDTAEPAEEDTGDEPIPVEEELPKAWYYAPVYWFDLWEGNVELGMSGSHGNSETFDYMIGLDAKRETEEHILDFDLRYDRKTADSLETAHRLFSEVRWELLFEDTSWTWFFHETTDYDEFKAYDLRLSYDTGLGRCLIKNDDTSLLARAGAGFSHEIGSPDEELVPEAVFGLQFSHKLNERQKVSGSSEYSPDVTDFLDYRLKSKASWEVLLDEETNLSLKVSILDRYDSTPYGKKPNDLDYTLTLLWKF